MTLIAAVLILAFIGIIYILYEDKALSATMYKIEQKNLPEEFNGLKLACLSDLHDNQYGRNNIRLLNMIDKFNPDYIVIAGDMIVSSDYSNIHVSLELLLKLSSRYKVIYAFGNHESRSEYAHENEEFTRYIEKLKAAGVVILRNSYIEIERKHKKMRIYGLELPLEYFKAYNRRRSGSKDKALGEEIEILLGKSDKSMYNILLAHLPNYFPVYAEWGADLVLSGHIHGGVMILPYLGGFISPLYEFFPKYDYGRFDENNSIMLLSRGLGTHTMPVRIFNKPELVCVRFDMVNILSSQKK